MSDGSGLSARITDEQQVPVDADRLVRVAIEAARSQEALGEISITLVTSERMADLNSTWMGAEGATDVLSFPVDGLVTIPREDPIMIGEVTVCPEYAADGAATDLPAELDLLVTHGVLHLLGFDHETEQGASAMRVIERRITGRAGASAT